MLGISQVVPLGLAAPTGLFDFIADSIQSQIVEVINNVVKDIAYNFAQLAWTMLESAFTNEQISAASWDTVSGENGTGFIYTWIQIMAPILVAIVAVQAAYSALKRNKAGIIRAGLGAVAGIPLSLLAVWLIEKFTSAMDEASLFISGQMGDTPVDAFMKVFGFKKLDGVAEGELNFEIDPEHWIWWVSGPSGAPVMGLVIMILVAIAALILNAMMLFRGFALLVAAAMAPIVVMMMPLEASKSWFTKWAELVTGLLIAKPLAFSVLTFSISMFESAEGPNATIMAIIGIIVAAFMPLLVLKFVSFTPVSSTSDMDQSAKGAAQAPARLASSVVRMRRRR